MGQADLGLMRVEHGNPALTHEDRVELRRGFIAAHPAHHLAWSLAAWDAPLSDAWAVANGYLE